MGVALVRSFRWDQDITNIYSGGIIFTLVGIIFIMSWVTVTSVPTLFLVQATCDDAVLSSGQYIP